MKRCLAGLALIAILAAAPVAACPPPSDTLIFHSCWGQGQLEILLLPEDLPLLEHTDASRSLLVTGAYTARESRDGGLAKPVGIFVRNRQVVNPNLGRMDGLLIVDPATGQPELHHRAQVRLDGREFDLRSIERRRAFLAEARLRGLGVMQSHLLIVDSRVDVQPQDNAPVFVRRILFTDKPGFGIYQTMRPVTLHDAATQLADALAPWMALNLDMGSYNYCERVEGGVESSCGAIARSDTGKLSNLLRLTLK